MRCRVSEKESSGMDFVSDADRECTSDILSDRDVIEDVIVSDNATLRLLVKFANDAVPLPAVSVLDSEVEQL